MKIMILTQPLLNNYGGLLQNFALQKLLKNLGHDPITYNLFFSAPPLYIYLFSWIKTILLFFCGKKRPFAKFHRSEKRKEITESFITDYLITTPTIGKYCSRIIRQSKANAIIVGSDQVWRPKYNRQIENMYFKFASNSPVLRIAYAASFGVDTWEYSYKQTCICSKLAKKFNAISVREESGIKLCKEHLGVDATWVLDPTLLLKKEDYLPICEDVPICKEKYLAVYVLDENEMVTATYEKEAISRGLVVKKFHADSKSTLTVPEWLAMFRDASFVVTDSFHGTVFSIIFGKEFKCIYNEGRGAARFESLLKLYNSGKLDEMREFSINWLKNALEN